MTHPAGSLFGLVALGIVSLVASAGCDGAPPSPPADGDVIADAGADGGADAYAVVTCCRLDNAGGERLDYKCGEQIDRGYLEGRGYRCWFAQ